MGERVIGDQAIGRRLRRLLRARKQEVKEWGRLAPCVAKLAEGGEGRRLKNLMKHLTLIRHAKSSWDETGLSDHDRPLAPRGLRDAPRVGDHLAQRFRESSERLPPDCFVSSTATRARETAALVVEAMGSNPDQDLQSEAQLYHPSVGDILAVANALDEKVSHAVFFGHNPGFHWACSEIDGNFQPEAFPTCAVASFDLEIEYWSLLVPGDGKVAFSFKPKDL